MMTAQKTFTLYAKTSGCIKCDLTKRALIKHGLLNRAGTDFISATDELEVKIIYIDLPKNKDILQNLVAEGFTTAPIVMLNFPITAPEGGECSTWTDFRPDLIEAVAESVKDGS